METVAKIENDQQSALEFILAALFYEDSRPKDLTHSALKLINEAKCLIGEENALFIEGILKFDMTENPFQFLSEAEHKGCQHPLIYSYLAECYRDGRKGVAQDASKVLEYSDMAIKGGCMSGYFKVLELYRLGCDQIKADKFKTLSYLLDLEREGYTGGDLLHKIGDTYKDHNGYGRSCALEYYQRAIRFSYVPALLALSRFWMTGEDNFPPDRNMAVLALLEAERKGLQDDRILDELVCDLSFNNTPFSDEVLGNFQNKVEMILHYCDVLVQRKSPGGYHLKGFLYWIGDVVPKDQAKAVSIWEEADKLGLVGQNLYCSYSSDLSYAYMEGEGVPKNGAKVLKYCQKALEVSTLLYHTGDIYRRMAKVYEKGIPPIEKDQAKAEELQRKADLIENG